MRVALPFLYPFPCGGRGRRREGGGEGRGGRGREREEKGRGRRGKGRERKRMGEDGRGRGKREEREGEGGGRERERETHSSYHSLSNSRDRKSLVGGLQEKIADQRGVICSVNPRRERVGRENEKMNSFNPTTSLYMTSLWVWQHN